MSNWQTYVDWFRKNKVPCPVRPDSRGVFRKGTIRSILPILRVYWAPSAASNTKDREALKVRNTSLAASLGIDQWPRFGDGRCRFFRADQLLDWLATVFPIEPEPQAFSSLPFASQ